MTALANLDVCLRPEHPSDIGSVRHVNVTAFERPNEADLVDALRSAGVATLSAVALLGASSSTRSAPSVDSQSRLDTGEVHGGEVVAHIMFTPVTVTTESGELPLVGLGPVAVLPEHQRKGIGTMLVSACLEYLRTRHHRGVVVVGEQGFFRRFGFIEASRWGLESESDVPNENFLALSLTPGVLGGLSGTVRYRSEYDLGPNVSQT